MSIPTNLRNEHVKNSFANAVCTYAWKTLSKREFSIASRKFANGFGKWLVLEQMILGIQFKSCSEERVKGQVFVEYADRRVKQIHSLLGRGRRTSHQLALRQSRVRPGQASIKSSHRKEESVFIKSLDCGKRNMIVVDRVTTVIESESVTRILRLW